MVQATRRHDLLNAQSRYVSDGFTVTVEYPVNLINLNEEDAEFQVCTGPVLLPDLATWDGRQPARVFLAHAAFSAFDHVEFILRRQVDAAPEERLWLDHARGRDRFELIDPAVAPLGHPPGGPARTPSTRPGSWPRRTPSWPRPTTPRVAENRPRLLPIRHQPQQMLLVAALQSGLYQRRGGDALQLRQAPRQHRRNRHAPRPEHLQHRCALRLHPACFATFRTALSSPRDPALHSLSAQERIVIRPVPSAAPSVRPIRRNAAVVASDSSASFKAP